MLWCMLYAWCLYFSLQSSEVIFFRENADTKTHAGRRNVLRHVRRLRYHSLRGLHFTRGLRMTSAPFEAAASLIFTGMRVRVFLLFTCALSSVMWF
uniref:Secreted protein n=1 Tax=Ixodes ricinus TaxID=34613 RepID=A0A6B0UD72_IXORI